MKLNPSLFIVPAMLALGMITSEAATVLTYTAQTPATQVSSVATGTHTIGSLIQVNVSGLSITQLGAMDTTGSRTTGSDGFVTTGAGISVGIWTTTGTLLAKAVVADSDTLSGGYRYSATMTNALNQPITSLALNQGQQYLIGAFVGGGLEWWLEDNTTNGVSGGPEMISATSSSDISLIQNRYGANSFTAPVTDGVGTGAGRWGAANAIFVPVPEPSAALLGGLGMLALLRRRRR